MKNNFLILIIFLFLSSCSKTTEKKEYRARVEVDLVKIKTIPIGLKAIGHCIPYNSVEIKAQVEGVLKELHYNEGSCVNEGELLFTIDPRPYEANLAKALAIRAENIAKLKFAAEKVARYEGLVEESYISQLDFDSLVKDLAECEATVMQNDAEILLSQINLDYCFIRAPFSGIVGKKRIDIGNLITNDGSTMVVINQIDPMFIDFSLPEKDFNTIMKYKKGHTPLIVEIQIPDYKKPQKAKLILVDNIINKQTGMVPLRAQVCNKENYFWPGQYVESTLILKQEKNAILVPSNAISTSQKGMFVYVVNSENKAEYKAIKRFNTYGEYTHVEGDLKSGDKVIIRGQINVKPGSICKIIKTGVKK